MSEQILRAAVEATIQHLRALRGRAGTPDGVHAEDIQPLINNLKAALDPPLTHSEPKAQAKPVKKKAPAKKK